MEFEHIQDGSHYIMGHGIFIVLTHVCNFVPAQLNFDCGTK